MSPRTQAKLHWFISVTITISLLIPIIEPLFAQGAGWLPPADPALQTVPEYRDEGYEPWVPFDEAGELINSKTPSFSLPAEADEVSDLMPTHLAQLVAVHDEVTQSQVARVTEQGATVSFLDGRVTIIADANSFSEPVTLALKPHFALTHAEQNEEINSVETPSSTEEALPVDGGEQTEETNLVEAPSSTEEALPVDGGEQTEETNLVEAPSSTEEALPIEEGEQTEETNLVEAPSSTEEALPIEEGEQTEETNPVETPSSVEEALPAEESETFNNNLESETGESSTEETPAINTSADSDDGFMPLPAPNPYPSEWLQFEIEAFRASDGQSVPLFDKELYMVIDLRDMHPNVLGQSWFLRFQDEEDPALWHDTRLTLHDEAGLFSTTTDHFSNWNAGYQPSAWRYQWNVPAVSTFSGAATFSYPIEVPAGRGGLTPNIDISYSSRGVDTLIFSDGMDQMPLGLGWNINNIEITRDNPHPKDDGAHVFMQHPARFSLVFNGNSYQLERMTTPINSATTVVRYYAINNPSLKIEHIRNNSAGNADKLYWRVVDGNGTVYRLGYTVDAESHHQNFVDVWGTNPEQPLQQLAGASEAYSGVRWRVDMITDVHGNQIQYNYVPNSQVESYQSTSGTWTYITTTSSRILEIRYSYVNQATNVDSPITSGTYANRILFEPSTYHPVSQINLYQVDLLTPYSRIKIGTGTYPTSNNACGQGARASQTNVVSSIRQENGDGSLHLPQTNFSYWVATNSIYNEQCYRFYRLQEVNNGYGGRIRFSYDTDNRIEDWWHWGLNRPPAYGRTFFVNRVETWDGIHTNPAVTDYHYQAPCYDQYDAVGSGLGTLPNAFNCATRPNVYGHNRYGHGKLIGFNSAIVTQKDYNGQILRRTDTAFHQDSRKTGWPSWEEVRDPNGFLLQKQETTYSQDFAANQFDFSFASQVKNTQYVRGGESTHHTVYYEYARQNNIQYGNLTSIRETGYIGGVGNNERRVLRDYYPNTTAWIVNAVARERVLGPNDKGLFRFDEFW